MGLFRKRKRRATRRAEAKALKHKATLEAKLGARNENKRNRAAEKAQRKLDKAAAKSRAKVEQAQIAAFKAEEKAAKKVEEKAARSGLSVSRVRRYLGLARLLTPILAPLAYRGATYVRGQVDARRAYRMGIAVEQLGDFTGHGARLSARVAGAENSAAEILNRQPNDTETQQFTTAIRTRLGDLTTAIRAAEHLPPSRRRSAHHAISTELDGIEADLLARLGVH